MFSICHFKKTTWLFLFLFSNLASFLEANYWLNRFCFCVLNKTMFLECLPIRNVCSLLLRKNYYSEMKMYLTFTFAEKNFFGFWWRKWTINSQTKDIFHIFKLRWTASSPKQVINYFKCFKRWSNFKCPAVKYISTSKI